MLVADENAAIDALSEILAFLRYDGAAYTIGLSRSVDGGTTWTAQEPNVHREINAVACSDSDQCQGDCLVATPVASGTPAQGTCQRDISENFGCRQEVRGGVGAAQDRTRHLDRRGGRALPAPRPPAVRPSGCR